MSGGPMELRTMRYFLAVAREENMTRAAEQLHVTQPTLSKQLKSLERELGKKLFVRRSFSIRLTEEGMLLRKRAEDLVSMADKIAEEFHGLNEVLGGDIYLGLAESYQIRRLAAVIKSLKALYPNLRYHITFITLWETLGLLTNYVTIMLITNGGPGVQTEVWALSAYHKAFADSQYGYGAAISLVLILVVMVLMLIIGAVMRRQEKARL